MARKLVSMPRELAQAVEDYRFANRIKSEAEAIRILLEAGVNAKANGQDSGGSVVGAVSPTAGPVEHT